MSWRRTALARSQSCRQRAHGSWPLKPALPSTRRWPTASRGCCLAPRPCSSSRGARRTRTAASGESRVRPCGRRCPLPRTPSTGRLPTDRIPSPCCRARTTSASPAWCRSGSAGWPHRPSPSTRSTSCPLRRQRSGPRRPCGAGRDPDVRTHPREAAAHPHRGGPARPRSRPGADRPARASLTYTKTPASAPMRPAAAVSRVCSAWLRSARGEPRPYARISPVARQSLRSRARRAVFVGVTVPRTCS